MLCKSYVYQLNVNWGAIKGVTTLCISLSFFFFNRFTIVCGKQDEQLASRKV